MSAATHHTCEDCAFWEDTGEGHGICRGHSPGILMVPELSDSPITWWPETDRDELACSRFKAGDL